MNDPDGGAAYVPLSQLDDTDAASLLPRGSQWECEPCATRFISSGLSPDCPYCALPLVARAGDESHSVFVPESVLPFKVAFAEASEAFQAWIKDQAGLSTPSDFVEKARADRMVGVYLPYFQFRCKTTSDYKVRSFTRGGKDEKGKQLYDESGPHSGTIDCEFVDLMVCATTALPVDLIEELEPWGLDDLQPYEGDLLDEYTIESRGDPGDLLELGKMRMTEPIKDRILSTVGGAFLVVDKLEVECLETRVRAFLFPLWIVSYRYKETVYRVLINARTGEVSGNRPTTLFYFYLIIYGTAALIAAIAGLIYMH